ncbi:MAG: hypothetical protein ACYSO2_01710 [Planctomycetota bacterium]
MYILLLALLAGHVQARVTIDADDPNIQYTGRINHADPKAPRMWWPGCDVFASFEGTSINVKFHDYGNNYAYVIIDDGTPSLIDLTPGASTYTAAAGLTDGVHTIRLFKRTETQEKEVAFKGFELDDGSSLVAPPPRPQRRIEYYGDSITSGHSVAATTGDTNEGWGKDNYYTYAAVTARNLNAEYHCISVSGIGLYVDKWEFGGNMQTLYYNKLSSRSSGHYPDAHIIFALGSMNATAPASPWPTYLQNAVNALSTTYGDAKVYSLIFPYSGDPHPTIARQAVMAAQLTEFINTSIPDPWLGNGDIDLDGNVNNADFSKLSRQWQQAGCGGCQGAALTGDGNVAIDDFWVLAGNWLNVTAIPGTQAPYPEGLAHAMPSRLEL